MSDAAAKVAMTAPVSGGLRAIAEEFSGSLNYSMPDPADVAARLEELLATVEADALARAAKLADPGEPPCDCITQIRSAIDGKLYWSVGCYCGNHGDLGDAYAWRSGRALCDSIRALAGEREGGE